MNSLPILCRIMWLAMGPMFDCVIAIQVNWSVWLELVSTQWQQNITKHETYVLLSLGFAVCAIAYQGMMRMNALQLVEAILHHRSQLIQCRCKKIGGWISKVLFETPHKISYIENVYFVEKWIFQSPRFTSSKAFFKPPPGPRFNQMINICSVIISGILKHQHVENSQGMCKISITNTCLKITYLTHFPTPSGIGHV